MVVVLGWERVVLERNEGRVEPISSSQVVELKVCDPMIWQVGDQNGRLLMHLGKRSGNPVQWLAEAISLSMATGWEQLVSTGLQATHVFQSSRRKVPTRDGSVKSC